MYCVEWNDDEPFEIYGYGQEDNFARIDIIFLPCNYQHTMLGF